MVSLIPVNSNICSTDFEGVQYRMHEKLRITDHFCGILRWVLLTMGGFPSQLTSKAESFYHVMTSSSFLPNVYPVLLIQLEARCTRYCTNTSICKRASCNTPWTVYVAFSIYIKGLYSCCLIMFEKMVTKIYVYDGNATDKIIHLRIIWSPSIGFHFICYGALCLLQNFGGQRFWATQVVVELELDYIRFDIAMVWNANGYFRHKTASLGVRSWVEIY